MFLHPMKHVVDFYGGERDRVGIGLSHRPAELPRLLESIPGLLKSFKKTVSGGPVRQPCSFSIPSPQLDCYKIPARGAENHARQVQNNQHMAYVCDNWRVV